MIAHVVRDSRACKRSPFNWQQRRERYGVLLDLAIFRLLGLIARSRLCTILRNSRHATKSLWNPPLKPRWTAWLPSVRRVLSPRSRLSSISPKRPMGIAAFAPLYLDRASWRSRSGPHRVLPSPRACPVREVASSQLLRHHGRALPKVILQDRLIIGKHAMQARMDCA